MFFDESRSKKHRRSKGIYETDCNSFASFFLGATSNSSHESASTTAGLLSTSGTFTGTAWMLDNTKLPKPSNKTS